VIPQLLTPELLTRFDHALHAAGAEIAQSWRPGLNDAEMDALAEAHGIVLPDEARAWWRWHNGTTPGSTAELTPGRVPLTLQSTLENFVELRDVIRDVEDAEARLKPISDAPWIYFACDVPRDAPVPIYVGDHGAESVLALPSIGELVAIWIDLIETGVYRVEDDGVWANTKWEGLPERVQKLGVY
jgi:hypothetical protein